MDKKKFYGAFNAGVQRTVIHWNAFQLVKKYFEMYKTILI